MQERGKSFADLIEETYSGGNMDIKVNSNWKGNGSGNVINVDEVTSDTRGEVVRFHTVQRADGSAPEPNEWGRVTMPKEVFLTRYSHWFD